MQRLSWPYRLVALIAFREWEEWIACALGRMDRGIPVGARLPAYGGDVHQPLSWDFDRVPRAPGALADPPPFGKRDGLVGLK